MYNEILKQIANALFINVQNIEDRGLLKGRLGVAVFFCHYSRYTENPIYAEWANEYIYEMLWTLDVDAIYDFADGSSGLAWSVSHLIENKFFEGADDIFNEIDYVVSGISFNDLNEELISTVPLFTRGLYFLQRKNETEIVKILSSIQEYFSVKEILPDTYINSLHFFIEQCINMGIEEKFINIKLSDIQRTESDRSVNSFFDHCWENFLFKKCIDCEEKPIILNDLQNMVDSFTYNLNYQNLSIYKGLSGLGLFLLSKSC